MTLYPLKMSWSEAVLIVALVGMFSNVDARPQRWIVSEGHPVEDSTPTSVRNGRADAEEFGAQSPSENPSDNSIPDTAIVTSPSTERLIDDDLSTTPTTTVTDASTSDSATVTIVSSTSATTDGSAFPGSEAPTTMVAGTAPSAVVYTVNPSSLATTLFVTSPEPTTASGVTSPRVPPSEGPRISPSRAPPSITAAQSSTTLIVNYEREGTTASSSTSATPPQNNWRDIPGGSPAVTPYVPRFNTPANPPPPASTPVCKFGKTPAWQFVKCKAKAFARKAKQVHGDAAKWIKEKSECLAKISRGAGHAIEQTRQCLMKINIRSRDIDDQLKTCFTGGDNRPENREWNEGVVCFTGLSPKIAGRSPTESDESTSTTAGTARKKLPDDFP